MLPLLASVLLFFSLPSSSSAACRRQCGRRHVPYPFGFSPDCEIPLNCSGSGEGRVLIGTFEVRDFRPETVLVDAPPNCSRPMGDLSALFGTNYAMTAKNALLATGCASQNSSCVIPTSLLYPRYLQCKASTQNISCLYRNGNTNNNQRDGLLTNEVVRGNGCRLLYSSMAFHEDDNTTMRVVSFEFGMVELRWWLKGDCRKCSSDAQCDRAPSPFAGTGITCRCKEGFRGNGFVSGGGCQKVSSRCNPSKYMSGSCGERTRVGVLIGGIVAGAALMAILAVICYYIRKRTTFLRTRKSTKRLLSEASCTVPLYPYKEIERSTNNFSDKNRLGTGAYGTVYIGNLHNDEQVAVKKLKNRDHDSIEQVMNEIKLLSSVSHPNLVRLLGCCIERNEQILVYEFMPNGTLSHHLQRGTGRGLPWTVRLNIATDTAKAIAHLHSAIHPPIYHRDIKSTNILLDHNFNSKLADFGLSRMIITESSHVSTAPQGTPGYLDPQYHQNFHLSDKSDVYSFGVVLVEIITALKVVDFNRGQSEVNLAALAIDKIGKGSVEDIIDPFLELHRDAWTLSSVHKVAELAFRCLAFHKDMRPSMIEVAEELEQIRLSGWAPSDDNILMSTASSAYSLSSNYTDKVQGASNSGHLVYVNPMADMKGDSPISMEDPWFSEQSSPSANSLLGHTVR